MRIVPEPYSIIRREGSFNFSRPLQTMVNTPVLSERVALFIADAERWGTCVFDAPAPRVATSSGLIPDGTIAFVIDRSDETRYGPEGYDIDVSAKAIRCSAATPEGIFYAGRTLLQLLMEYRLSQELPKVEIFDKPEFSWRGAMLDSSRHFQKPEDIRRFIDLLAFHKLNVFHWHLSDDQGWRVEILGKPSLAKTGSRRKKTLIGHHSMKPWRYDEKSYGGSYSQEDIREIVEYAALRGVSILPEIDIPGHTQAMIAAYRELGTFKDKINPACEWGIKEFLLDPTDKTMDFLKEVFAEVCGLFPFPYVHIGGDEAVKNQWRASARVQLRIGELGLADEEALQGWMLRRLEEFLASKGKKMIGWDEILEGGPRASTAVMSWRGSEGAVLAAKNGHDTVMASKEAYYLDYYQWDPATQPLAIGGLTTAERTYSFDPVPADFNSEDKKHLLGLQVQLWTEYMPNMDAVEYMAFPRLCAASESAWLPKERRDWKRFKAAWQVHRQRLDKMGVGYYNGPLEQK